MDDDDVQVVSSTQPAPEPCVRIKFRVNGISTTRPSSELLKGDERASPPGGMWSVLYRYNDPNYLSVFVQGVVRG